MHFGQVMMLIVDANSTNMLQLLFFDVPRRLLWFAQKNRIAKPRPLQEPLQQGKENSTWPTLPCGSAVQVLLLLDTRARGGSGLQFSWKQN